MITFFNAKTNAPYGVIGLHEGRLTASTFALQDIADAWTGTPAEFEKHYAEWTNAYMYSRAGDLT